MVSKQCWFQELNYGSSDRLIRNMRRGKERRGEKGEKVQQNKTHVCMHVSTPVVLTHLPWFSMQPPETRTTVETE